MSAADGSGVPLLPHNTRLLHLSSCGSTNSEALAQASRGHELPLWVLADLQTGGRGRDGRSWQSEPGNLMTSLAVPLDAPAAVAAQLSLVAGVAAIDAIRSAAGEGQPVAGLRLKWPNDILVEGAKVGGILVEAAPVRGTRIAVVGFGINLLRAVQVEGRRVTCLAEHGISRKPLEMLAFLAEAMHEWLARWRQGAGFGEVREAWLARSGPAGERIAVNAGGTKVEGRFAGLEEDGALLLADAHGTTRRITFGDVTLL